MKTMIRPGRYWLEAPAGPLLWMRKKDKSTHYSSVAAPSSRISTSGNTTVHRPDSSPSIHLTFLSKEEALHCHISSTFLTILCLHFSKYQTNLTIKCAALKGQFTPTPKIHVFPLDKRKKLNINASFQKS